MLDHGMLQLLCNVARLEAGAKPAINEGLAKEAIARGFLIKWRDGYVRTRLGKDLLRYSIGASNIPGAISGAISSAVRAPEMAYG